MRKLVSVIMPAFNAENYIADSIESVLAQTYHEWELLIVNDGSTDSTQHIINKYVKIDNRIKCYYQENGKQGKARNFAISNSQGYYLAFLDADDLWMAQKLEIQIEEIQKTNSDLVFSKSYVFKDYNFDEKKTLLDHEGFLSGEIGLGKLLESNIIPILTVLVKKEKVLKVNSFSENLFITNAEDYHLWLKLLMNGNIFWASSNILAAYRILVNSSTGIDKSARNVLPYVYFDLLAEFPIRKILIKKRLKKSFNEIYKKSVRDKNDCIAIIVVNCSFLNKKYLILPLSLIAKILPLSLTKLILKKVVNI